MRTSLVPRTCARLLRALAIAALLAAWSPAGAQTNTARISGTVTGEGGTPIADVTIGARSLSTNLVRNAMTSPRGFYVLAGLPPDEYELTVRRLGFAPQTRRVRAQIGQQLSIDFTLSTAAVELAAQVVVASPIEAERRSPEVATNVSVEQIENLPVSDRDFLEFATLAPGVVASHNRNGITASGLSPNLVNVYIDGASFKNEVLQGGIAGQDASGGNPFPQAAVREFRVISQQYKAEYAKATSAIVTATTKSGTNEWEGEAFYYGQNERMIAETYFQRRDPGFDAATFGKNQFGLAVGGPIVRDRLFFFFSGEANHQNQALTVRQPDLTGAPQNVVDDLTGIGGTFNAPLRSNLFFGKLTYQPGERHRWETSVNVRDEYEIRGFGGNTARSRGEHFNNDVYTGIVSHQYTRGNLLNEANFNVQRYQWKPIRFEGTTVGRVYTDYGTTGGRSTEQDFIQDKATLRNDVTYTVPEWNGAHIFKAGATLAFSRYDITRHLFGNPEFTFRSQENWAFPFQAQMGVGDPNVESNNTQVGLYVQDDWNITPRFLLSLGIRWDYESSMLNADWRTPDSVRVEAAPWITPVPGWENKTTERFFAEPSKRKPFLGAFQPRLGFSWEVPQLDNATLFGGVGLYYDREYAGIAIGEKLNISYPRYIFRFSQNGGLDPAGNPTIAWDPRYLSREGLEEIIASGSSAARPELPMLPNDLEPPKAYQWSAGVRKALGRYNASVSYSGVRGYNKLTYFFGNRQAWGACCQQGPDFGNLLLAEPIGESRYHGLFLTLERPFLNEGRWSWGGAVNYTLSKAESTIPVGSNFTLHAYTPGDLEWQPDETDERHRVVAHFITMFPLGIQLSSIINLGSGRPFNVVFGGDPPPEVCEAYYPGSNCGQRLPACALPANQGGPPQPCAGNFLTDDYPRGFVRNSGRPPKKGFIIPNAWAYRDVDVRLQKDFAVGGGQRVSAMIEVFNVFNYDNFSGFNGTVASYVRVNNANPTDPVVNRMNPSANFGQPNSVVVDSSRRLQAGMKYTF
jgi:hypothetical protein